MSQWKSVSANSNLILRETEKGVLIKFPKSDRRFWHPKKLVRTSGKSGYHMRISYTDAFEFRTFRMGKRGVMDEEVMSVADFEAYFE